MPDVVGVNKCLVSNSTDIHVYVRSTTNILKPVTCRYRFLTYSAWLQVQLNFVFYYKWECLPQEKVCESKCNNIYAKLQTNKLQQTYKANIVSLHIHGTFVASQKCCKSQALIFPDIHIWCAPTLESICRWHYWHSNTPTHTPYCKDLCN